MCSRSYVWPSQREYLQLFSEILVHCTVAAYLHIIIVVSVTVAACPRSGAASAVTSGDVTRYWYMMLHWRVISTSRGRAGDASVTLDDLEHPAGTDYNMRCAAVPRRSAIILKSDVCVERQPVRDRGVMWQRRNTCDWFYEMFTSRVAVYFLPVVAQLRYTNLLTSRIIFRLVVAFNVKRCKVCLDYTLC